MRLFSPRTLASAFTTLLLISVSAHATNGYFLIGYGAKSRSMGGVGVAYAQDGLAAAANPAGMADATPGALRIDFGGELFIPRRGFMHDSATLESGFPPESDTGVNHLSGANEFLIPSMGMVYKFNRKITIGFAVIGNGANTRYKQTVPGIPTCHDGDTSGGVGSTAFNFNCIGSPTLGAQLLQAQMLPSVAFRVTRNQSVGMSLAIAVQQFRAYGLQAFKDAGTEPRGLGFSAGAGKLTNMGNDWSYGSGIRLGWLGKFLDEKLSLGANYASRVYMTKFDKYSNLFAEHGDFDIPSHWAVGLAYKLNDKLTVASDFQRINYGEIASLNNPGPNAADPANFFPPGYTVTGADNGLGFGWSDINVYKIGFNYDYSQQWSFRAGFNYAKTPIKPDQILFNFLAPAVVEKHVTLGASYRPSKSVEWSFNYMHAFRNTIKGPTAFGPAASAGQPVNGTNGSIDMYIDSLGVSFAYMM